MRPYFIIMSGIISERDNTVDFLVNVAGLRRTHIHTSDESKAISNESYTFYDYKPIYTLGQKDMMLVNGRGKHTYGIKVEEIENSDVVAANFDDAFQIKAFCLGAKRPCYIIGINPLSEMSQEIADIYLDKSNVAELLGFVIKKTLKEL